MSLENLSPELFSVGATRAIGLVAGFAIKKVRVKILAVIPLLNCSNLFSITKPDKAKFGRHGSNYYPVRYNSPSNTDCD